MNVNVIELGDVHIITCLMSGAEDKDAGLKFCCHDQAQVVCYKEDLPLGDFLQRIKLLNKRVGFPEKVVRQLLNSAQPAEATLRPATEHAAAVGEGVTAVLSLKYRVEGTPAPLKWEWHLRSKDSDVIQFYRHVLRRTMQTAAYLTKNQDLLLDVIRKKDIELKQYRLDGARHWRTTVATEPFDVEAFQERNKELLGSVPVGAAAIKVETPATSLAASATKSLSPRNRKRKAMQTSKEHVERKVLQRRRVPQLQYKSSQSQESDVDAMLAQSNANARIEVTLKVEPKSEEPEEPAQSNGESAQSEIDELFQFVDRTVAQTNKILEEHRSAYER